jgi:hypothetical protein
MFVSINVASLSMTIVFIKMKAIIFNAIPTIMHLKDAKLVTWLYNRYAFIFSAPHFLSGTYVYVRLKCRHAPRTQ